MTHEQLDLARQLIASPCWRWLPGMRVAAWTFTFARCVTHWGDPKMAEEEEAVCCTGSYCGASVSDAASLMRPTDAPWRPDLSDPATVGCIAHLAMDAWGCHLRTALENETYYVDRTNPDIPTRTIQVASGPCIGSAWAMALLAAPEPTP